MLPVKPTPQVLRTMFKMASGILATTGFGLLWLSPLNTSATGFEPLPISGVLRDDGTSAYILCNASGKFDESKNHNIPRKPTLSQSNTCAIFPANDIAAPLPGFNLLKHASRQVVMNNALTGYADKKIASVLDIVWRNQASSECIYGTRVLAFSSADADYNDQLPGKQYFRITDIARGGFAGREVEVAYALTASGAEPIYRVGRSYTAVQYYKRPGYQRQPLIEPAFHNAINGVDSTEHITPEFRQQSASLNENWVNFTTLIGLPKRPASPMMYVKAACSSAPPTEQPATIRLRQAISPFIELNVPGFVASNSNSTETTQP